MHRSQRWLKNVRFIIVKCLLVARNDAHTTQMQCGNTKKFCSCKFVSKRRSKFVVMRKQGPISSIYLPFAQKLVREDFFFVLSNLINFWHFLSIYCWDTWRKRCLKTQGLDLTLKFFLKKFLMDLLAIWPHKKLILSTRAILELIAKI